MAERTSYPTGTPNWVDVGAADVEGAHRFYRELFGWEIMPGGEEVGYYAACALGGKPVAGIGARPDPSVPSRWSMYIASDDVDGTAKLITEHGGQLLTEPMDVMQFGRSCFATDPTGGVFAVWQAVEHIGAGRVNEAGAFTWSELNTRDGATADAFYRNVFGYGEPEQIGDGTSFDYTLWKVNGEVVCGRMQVDDQWPADMPAHWMVYFAVDNADTAAARVTELGGTVHSGPFDSPYGRLAVVADPWGATFSIIQPPDEPPTT